jgi:hypothetical protein
MKGPGIENLAGGDCIFAKRYGDHGAVCARKYFSKSVDTQFVSSIVSSIAVVRVRSFLEIFCLDEGMIWFCLTQPGDVGSKPAETYGTTALEEEQKIR